MEYNFKIGDYVKWNSEAGHVSGKIIKIHTADFDYKGYTHHATKEDPQVCHTKRQDRPYCCA